MAAVARGIAFGIGDGSDAVDCKRAVAGNRNVDYFFQLEEIGREDWLRGLTAEGKDKPECRSAT